MEVIALNKTGLKNTELLLDLNTLVERPLIKIDGMYYHMKRYEDLGAVESIQLFKVQEQMQEMQDIPSEEMTPEIAGKFGAYIRMAANTLLDDVPDDVRERLTEAQCLMICNVFRTAVAEPAQARSTMPTPLPTNRQRVAKSIGAPSSRASNASTTPATRKPGSTSRKRS